MRKQDSADLTEDDISMYFANGYQPGFGHATNVASLVLERLPSGEHAWLRSGLNAALDQRHDHLCRCPDCRPQPLEDDDALYVPTERGRDQVDRWAAERSLFGHEAT